MIDIEHFARVQVAHVVRMIADETPAAVDMMLARHWISASVDVVVTITTGRTIGEWTAKGLNKLADEIQAKEALGTSVWQMTAALTHGAGSTAMKTWEHEIRKDMQDQDPYAGLRERPPQDSALFASWAVKKANEMGMTLTSFLIARREIGV